MIVARLIDSMVKSSAKANAPGCMRSGQPGRTGGNFRQARTGLEQIAEASASRMRRAAAGDATTSTVANGSMRCGVPIAGIGALHHSAVLAARGRRCDLSLRRVSSKSKMSMFSAIRFGFTDFGMAMFIGCWMCHLSTICARVFALARAISTIAGSSRSRARPSGAVGRDRDAEPSRGRNQFAVGRARDDARPG